MNIRQSKRTVIAHVGKAVDGWLVTDSDGQVYRTFNQWMAALADEYKAKAVPVDVHFTHGWLHRDLTGIVKASEPQKQPQMIDCSWCRKIVRDGSRPATSTICPDCTAKMNAELDAKYGATP